MAFHHDLRCHPDTPAIAVRSVAVDVTMGEGNGIRLAFYVSPAGSLKVPTLASSGRIDELWRRTCFEMFLKAEGKEGYCEFNLSPSSEWAAYAFDGYRAGMRDLALPVPPQIEREWQGEAFVLEATLALSTVWSAPMLAGFSAVIEETDGTKSYWALAHLPGKPDFHHEACFAADLPAPRSA